MQILKDFIFNLLEQTGMSEELNKALVSLTAIAIWLFLGFIFSRIAKRIINKLKAKEKHLVKRKKTITALVLSLAKYLFWFIMFMMVLLELGIDLAPVLASAGILGFAVGFGAQELVKDLISGFFIVFENAFDVGDVIQIGDFKGTVLEIGMRRTKIRNWKNEIRLINNGDIRVINQYSVGDSVGVVDFQITPTFDISVFYTEEFQNILNSYADHPDMIDAPRFVGVIESQIYNITLRVQFKTLNNKHVGLERSIRHDIMIFLRKKREENKV
ncbi:mechanosensitive ion channel family protein [Acholeplasma hippikon]|uniref:Small-conductance mechanosensitive channel n=1 Tax=Acholeplasma hippikon TaxID=264636 RepID=A0A449BLM0_9MOLU|nr:mechanosensitive ion channel domain-containing protein [Acholeplasma hippikon]VEU83337.1 Small-conductance mechanosensitive channel [Acholeplasma hippikon]